MTSDSSKDDVTNKLFAYKSYMHEQDLALNNPEGLICHKTKPTNQPTKHIYTYIYIYIYIYI